MVEVRGAPATSHEHPCEPDERPRGSRRPWRGAPARRRRDPRPVGRVAAARNERRRIETQRAPHLRRPTPPPTAHEAATATHQPAPPATSTSAAQPPRPIPHDHPLAPAQPPASAPGPAHPAAGTAAPATARCTPPSPSRRCAAPQTCRTAFPTLVGPNDNRRCDSVNRDIVRLRPGDGEVDRQAVALRVLVVGPEPDLVRRGFGRSRSPARSSCRSSGCSEPGSSSRSTYHHDPLGVADQGLDVLDAVVVGHRDRHRDGSASRRQARGIDVRVGEVRRLVRRVPAPRSGRAEPERSPTAWAPGATKRQRSDEQHDKSVTNEHGSPRRSASVQALDT